MEMADEQKGMGITITEWAAGAARPDDTKTEGHILVKGKAMNNAPIMMVGVISVTATNGEKTVTGQQRFFSPGKFLGGILGSQKKDFTIDLVVADIGAVGTVWKGTLQSANGLGLMNTQYKKEFEVVVKSVMVAPVITPVTPPGGGPTQG